MNIAILGPSHVPFMWGGLENLSHGLANYFNLGTEHRADLIRIPTRELSLPDLVESYYQWARVDLSGFDLVVSLKYPTWIAEHPRHVLWMAHRLRGLYDTYPSQLGHRVEGLAKEVEATRRLLLEACQHGASATEATAIAMDLVSRARHHNPEALGLPSPLARDIIHALDDLALSPSRISRYAALARAVSSREGYFPRNVPITIIHPPPSRSDFVTGPNGEAFFTASRLDAPKRVDLIVKAFRRSNARGPLRIAGAGPEAERLRRLAGDDPRIEFLGFLSDEELRRQFSTARAVVFCPKDEDFGYVTLEAFLSGKPVITTTDAGGPRELVEHERSGMVVPPTEKALAAAFERFDTEPKLAADYGSRGLELARGITWKKVVDELLAPASSKEPPALRKSKRKSIVVTVPFSATPPTGGGRVRVFELYQRLAKHLDITLLCFEASGASGDRYIAPGLREIVIGASPAHRAKEQELGAALGWLPLSDVALPLLSEFSPDLGRTFDQLARRASLQIACHPYLATEMAAHAGRIPFVYEAQDVEVDLKEQVFSATPAARPLVEATRSIEGWCLETANLVWACSSRDQELLTTRYPSAQPPFAIVPNGVDERQTTYLSLEARGAAKKKGQRPLCVFVGSWHPPNLDAVESILGLAEKCPRVDFKVLGNLDSQFKKRRLPNNVAMTGFVRATEKLALLHRADLALNPMRYGSGTNLKLLEYFAAGTPVLTTELGLRGLEEFREHVLVSPLEEFRESLEAVLGRPVIERVDTAGARRLIERAYSWDSIASKAYTSLKGLL